MASKCTIYQTCISVYWIVCEMIAIDVHQIKFHCGFLHIRKNKNFRLNADKFFNKFSFSLLLLALLSTMPRKHSFLAKKIRRAREEKKVEVEMKMNSAIKFKVSSRQKGMK